jgi:dipeptidyl-peptidase 4
VSSTSLPEQLFRTQRFALGVPGQFTVSRDGTVVLFLRSRTGEDRAGCLWALDVTSGTERLLADPAGLPGSCGPAPPAGIDGYAADLAAGLAAFTLAGELWTVEVGTGEAGTGATRRLPARPGAAGPLPDPAGRRIAYTCEGGRP